MPYDMRTARAWVDEDGQWWLAVAGTDIQKDALWRDEDIEHGNFPGASLGYRLIERGWTPDKRALHLGSPILSRVQRLALTAMAGWRPAGENSWVIPCYREVDAVSDQAADHSPPGDGSTARA